MELKKGSEPVRAKNLFLFEQPAHGSVSRSPNDSEVIL